MVSKHNSIEHLFGGRVQARAAASISISCRSLYIYLDDCTYIPWPTEPRLSVTGQYKGLCIDCESPANPIDVTPYQ